MAPPGLSSSVPNYVYLFLNYTVQISGEDDPNQILVSQRITHKLGSYFQIPCPPENFS